jgi:short-subunit dehydrogenase
MHGLNGDWALITGASSVIGHEMAKILAGRGQNMILVSADEEHLCQMARELNEISDIIIMPVDLSKSGSSALLFNECERLGLKINVLLNFAQENI